MSRARSVVRGRRVRQRDSARKLPTDGGNERGLAIPLDYAFVMDSGPPNPPVSMLIGEALASCAAVIEAVQQITARPRWGPKGTAMKALARKAPALAARFAGNPKESPVVTSSARP